MIGNDIVDLEFAKQNSRWQEQRFLDKLFLKEEQEFIRSDGNRFENIWKLWSMKESAYKIISRADGIVRFNPKDFKCFFRNTTQGNVIFEDISFSTVTQTNENFIQTTAYSIPHWISVVFQFPNSDSNAQHRQSHQYAVEVYAKLKNVSQESVEIVKNKIGVPEFYIQGDLLQAQLSLSHHGHFGALAIAV